MALTPSGQKMTATDRRASFMDPKRSTQAESIATHSSTYRKMSRSAAQAQRLNTPSGSKANSRRPLSLPPLEHVHRVARSRVSSAADNSIQPLTATMPCRCYAASAHLPCRKGKRQLRAPSWAYKKYPPPASRASHRLTPSVFSLSHDGILSPSALAILSTSW